MIEIQYFVVGLFLQIPFHIFLKVYVNVNYKRLIIKCLIMEKCDKLPISTFRQLNLELELKQNERNNNSWVQGHVISMLTFVVFLHLIVKPLFKRKLVSEITHQCYGFNHCYVLQVSQT